MLHDPHVREPVDEEAHAYGEHDAVGPEAVPVEEVGEHAAKDGDVLELGLVAGHEEHEERDGRGEDERQREAQALHEHLARDTRRHEAHARRDDVHHKRHQVAGTAAARAAEEQVMTQRIDDERRRCRQLGEVEAAADVDELRLNVARQQQVVEGEEERYLERTHEQVDLGVVLAQLGDARLYEDDGAIRAVRHLGVVLPVAERDEHARDRHVHDEVAVVALLHASCWTRAVPSTQEQKKRNQLYIYRNLNFFGLDQGC